MDHPLKSEVCASDFEVNSQEDVHLRSKLRTLGVVDGVRVGLTVLALLAGVTVLGISADALAVYSATHVAADFYLPLWPENFDLQPAVALCVGSVIVVVASFVSLLCSKVQTLRARAAVHTPLMFAAPLVGFVAALVATVFFYAVNGSTTTDSLLSWTCRWTAVPMSSRPHFATLCSESWAAVYLSVLLIPIEAGVLAAAGWQVKIERHAAAYADARKQASPVMG